MSKPTKEPDDKDLKQYHGIAKICFFIIIFNIVVRLDLWVSFAGMIILLPYLLQRLLLKKLDVAKYLKLFNNSIETIKKVHQTQEIEPTQSTTVDFAEPSFEEIWQDCPQSDLVWN